MNENASGGSVVIRPFRWSDLAALHDAMRRVGAAPYEFADDPVAGLAADLRQPRIDATSDVFLATRGDRVVGWTRVDLEPGIGRAVATSGTDPAAGDQSLRQRLVEAAIDRAREARIAVLHIPVGDRDGSFGATLRTLGFAVVRHYHRMARRTAPRAAGAHEPSPPGGCSIRGMSKHGEEQALADIQNAAFTGSWGFSPNSVEEIAASLALPGSGPEGVVFAGSGSGRPVAYAWTRLEPYPGAPVGYIGMIGVHPDRRRAGLGRAVLAAALRLLEERGAAEVRLEVDAANESAIRLYRSFEFGRRAEIAWYEFRLARPGDRPGPTPA